MNYIKCISKTYDADLDLWWVLFECKDDNDDVIQFRMPINEEDFEIGEFYKVTFFKK